MKAKLPNEVTRKTKVELYNDNFENFKRYQIPKAQLMIADIPYNIGNNAYASNPSWYKGGDNKNGESEKANANFFNRDERFNVINFMKFARKMLIKEPKERGKAPAMIVFCAWEQIPMLVETGKKEGFNHAYPLIFVKKSSSQALKANMKIVDPTAGSGSTLRAAAELNRSAYGFEVERDIYNKANEKMLSVIEMSLV